MEPRHGMTSNGLSPLTAPGDRQREIPDFLPSLAMSGSEDGCEPVMLAKMPMTIRPAAVEESIPSVVDTNVIPTR
jgi:hypothetical protein